jgi:hypothetical protein
VSGCDAVSDPEGPGPVEAEIVEADMTVEEAQRVTEAIRGHLSDAWELIGDAYHRRAWVAMCYESWDAYCLGEFGDARLRIPREERPELVCSLRQSGMSIRAIASATGVSKNTVASDVSQIGTPASVTGTDGRVYPAKPRPKPKREPKREPLRLESFTVDVHWPRPTDTGVELNVCVTTQTNTFFVTTGAGITNPRLAGDLAWHLRHGVVPAVLELVEKLDRRAQR